MFMSMTTRTWLINEPYFVVCDKFIAKNTIETKYTILKKQLTITGYKKIILKGQIHFIDF